MSQPELNPRFTEMARRMKTALSLLRDIPTEDLELLDSEAARFALRLKIAEIVRKVRAKSEPENPDKWLE